MTEKKATKEPAKPKKEVPVRILTEAEKPRWALRRYVRIFYDLQRMRIAAGGRTKSLAAQLFEKDRARFDAYENALQKLEDDAYDDIKKMLKTIPFFVDVLSERPRFRGIGPTMAGVILSEFDINRASTPSDFWAYAGLHVVDGHAPKLVKGEKAKFNKWLRTRMVGVLADVLIKCKSPWTKLYYDYKHRKESAGWGKHDMHRHVASKRYMIKMLLLDIWRRWREHAGLPLRESYHEQYILGHAHDPQDPLRMGEPPEMAEQEDNPEVDAELEMVLAAESEISGEETSQPI